jgi:chromate transporter
MKDVDQSINHSARVLKPTFKEAFKFWLKLGFISFGGPAGQIAIMHEFLVEKKKWISDSRFLHALNYCMILPGPEAQQLATYIGWLLHGTAGGITAGLLFILPSVFILLGLSIVYVTFGKLFWVAAVFYGLKPAVVAIVIVALIKIGTRSLKTFFHYGVAFISFIAIYFYNVPFPILIIAAILIGLAVIKYKPSFLKVTESDKTKNDDDGSYYLNSQNIESRMTAANGLFRKLVVALVLWSLPVVLFYALGDDVDFWMLITGFFTKAALVTFGGAYAVLPYVAQTSVEKFDWLTQPQMIDGLALGETTPGPLIMVLAFVGFMAAYNHFGTSLLAGTIGLLVTTFYTFLPSFVFILAGAPLVERTNENKLLKELLTIVTAAVVGVILNLTIYFAKGVVFHKGVSQPDWFALLWILISFVALYRFKISMMLWIGVSAVIGFFYLVVL